MQKEINWLLKEKYSGKPNKKFYADVKRLKKGEPVDYVIGFAEFLGCKIDLSKKPLIPRQETQFWAAKAINEIKEKPFPKAPWLKSTLSRNFQPRVLDLFAGSGCVGVAVLAHCQNAKVDFSDNDKKAIAQIKINIKLNTNGLIRTNGSIVVRSDMFEKIKGKYDFILANPPYIPTTRKSKLPKSVVKFEPKKALFGGKDGLFYIKKFLKEAGKYLNDGGVAYMEFDSVQKSKIEKLLKALGQYSKYNFQKDQFGRWRWVEICK